MFLLWIALSYLLMLNLCLQSSYWWCCLIPKKNKGCVNFIPLDIEIIELFSVTKLCSVCLCWWYFCSWWKCQPFSFNFSNWCIWLWSKIDKFLFIMLWFPKMDGSPSLLSLCYPKLIPVIISNIKFWGFILVYWVIKLYFDS